ncbi:hypothetical protein MSL71_3800 [Desulfoluna butyratoxydans]|uniref:Uncharacterized protein n=1 Tax=Desulfoluna butyratoxydans TaxID=231438 RepID=A0A4U8YII8_9BACT|nr:hypothetical protein MSL71_3800 [Desulfoluna butyratoxydans]
MCESRYHILTTCIYCEYIEFLSPCVYNGSFICDCFLV